MGGTKEYFESLKQEKKACKELKLVEFYSFFSSRTNTSLIDEEVIEKDVKKEITDYLKSLKVNHTELELGMGGGGELLESFLYLVNQLKENWKFITFSISVFKLLKNYCTAYLLNKLYEARPEVNLSFFVGTGQEIDKIDKNTLNSIIRNHTGSLFLISTEIAQRLHSKYPFINFNLSNTIRFNSGKYLVKIHLPASKNNDLNKGKIFKIIQNLKYKNDKTFELAYNKFLFFRKYNRRYEEY